MLTRTVLETRIRGRLVNRGCRIVDVVHLSTGMVVYFVNRDGKLGRRTYPYRKAV